MLVAHPSVELYGSDRMLLESVTGMVAAGLEVTATLPGPGPLADELRRVGAAVVSCPAPVLRKAALRPGGLAGLAATTVLGAVRGLALLVRTRPAAVYVSTLTVPSWIVLARLVRRPVVCHVHEAESEAAPRVRRLLASPLLLATRLLVNSRFAAGVLADSFPVLGTRSTVVLNAVAAPAPRPPRWGPGPSRVLYVGRLSERKGVLVALDAVATLLERGVDVRLDLVGDVFAGHGDFARRLDARLAAPPLAGRVTRHGFHADVWPFLAGCDVLVVPSTLPEPFGNVAVEGVLAGRPVVGSDIGGIPEALDGYGGATLVPPGDPVALDQALARLLADPVAAAAPAEADAAAARARHDPGGYRDAVLAALRDVGVDVPLR